MSREKPGHVPPTGTGAPAADGALAGGREEASPSLSKPLAEKGPNYAAFAELLAKRYTKDWHRRLQEGESGR